MIALALALLLVLGAGGCTPQKKGSAGILYRVTGGKSDLYLLGSIHVGSEDMYRIFWTQWRRRMCWPLSAIPQARRRRPPIRS